MTNSQRLATVRAALEHWLSCRDAERDENQQAKNDSHETRGKTESLLIRGGFYCGRRFDFGSHQAIWFLEEDQIKIHDQDGRILCTMSSNEIDRWARTSDDFSSRRAA